MCIDVGLSCSYLTFYHSTILFTNWKLWEKGNLSPKDIFPYEITTEALTEALKYILVQLKIGFIALRRDF